VVAVAEAEGLVGAWRARHDPSAALGVPAHITVLYPFEDPGRIDGALETELAGIFATVSPFEFWLRGPAALGPDILALAPEPAEPFEHLTGLVWERWPEMPPYGGAFETVIPHLTVADAGPAVLAQALERIGRGLPIAADCREVQLFEEGDDGRWRLRSSFPLGADTWQP
jgi:hypothetical protein